MQTEKACEEQQGRKRRQSTGNTENEGFEVSVLFSSNRLAFVTLFALIAIFCFAPLLVNWLQAN